MRVVEEVHAFVRRHLRSGAIAIDATAGNGHDSVFLAEAVGPTGHVFCIDIQSRALGNTRARLDALKLTARVSLIEADHADLAHLVPRHLHPRIGAILFNLGYLPGADKALITRPESSVAALDSALAMLPPRGVIAVVGYRGHPGGEDECHVIAQRLSDITPSPRIVDTGVPGPIAWLIGPGYRRD